MRQPGGVETRIGFFILVVLAGVLAAVLAVQSRYDPALFKALEVKGQAAPAGDTGAPAAGDSSFAGLAPDGLALLGREETFDSETLSDKIDGKAELYLSSGFVRLATQRFSRTDDPKNWLELFVYDMGEARNAFSVYSLQKRTDARKIDLGAFAYGTENAIFFVSGSKYVEIVSAEAGPADDMIALAKNIVQAQPAQAAEGLELSSFPAEALDQASISLHMSDVFGCAALNNVYTAKYRAGGERVTAFLSRRENAEESAALAAEYGRFLLENGGSELGEVPGAPGSKLFQVFDTYEAVLHRGAFFAGTHEVESRDAAEQIAARIYRKLSEAP
ncbi:MAG: DUF6599 family protein [Syntrophobacteraceae bacterium]